MWFCKLLQRDVGAGQALVGIKLNVLDQLIISCPIIQNKLLYKKTCWMIICAFLLLKNPV